MRKAGKLEKLEDFLSRFGAEWYGFPLNEGTIAVVREDWKIPKEIIASGSGDVIIPWMAERKVHWKVQ